MAVIYSDCCGPQIKLEARRCPSFPYLARALRFGTAHRSYPADSALGINQFLTCYQRKTGRSSPQLENRSVVKIGPTNIEYLLLVMCLDQLSGPIFRKRGGADWLHYGWGCSYG